MQKYFAVMLLALLAACQSTPSLENDARYVKLAKVVDVHEFTDAERKEAAKTQRPKSSVGVGIGIGVSSGGGGFGGLMFGVGSGGNNRHEPPQIVDGANRYTVQPLNTSERIEVMSDKHYKVGDCVKVLLGHPSEYVRLFDPKANERCN